MGGYLEGLGVQCGDVVLVFEIDIQMALAVGDGLLRRSAQVECANYGAILGLDHGRVGLAVTENPDPLVKRIEQNAVRVALHLNGLDGLEGLGIPHDDGLAAAEAVM